MNQNMSSDSIYARGDENYRKVLEDKRNGTFKVFTSLEQEQAFAAADLRFKQALAERTARLGPLEVHRCISCRITQIDLHHKEYIQQGWILDVEGFDYCPASHCNAKGLRARSIRTKAEKAGQVPKSAVH